MISATICKIVLQPVKLEKRNDLLLIVIVWSHIEICVRRRPSTETYGKHYKH